MTRLTLGRPRGLNAAQQHDEQVMVTMAADQLLTGNNTHHPIDLSVPFNLTVDTPTPPSSLPRSLNIAVWNCRGGIESKLVELQHLFRISNCDVLVLNETFRRPGVPWPSYFPPLIAESTDQSNSLTRCAGGVAVVANPANIARIKSISVLDNPSTDGTKVCVRVNNLIILGVYIPPSSPQLLEVYSSLAHQLTAGNTPVVICGDMNAHSRQFGAASQNLAGSYLEYLVHPRGSSSFFRADTGVAPTRPSTNGSGGSIIDFIFAANSNLADGRCFDSVDWSSDHRPISCVATPPSTSLR